MLPGKEFLEKSNFRTEFHVQCIGVDIVMLFLVYVLDYDSQNVLEKKYKVPDATAGRVITWMIKKLKLINTIFTKCLTYEQRLKVTEDYISTGEMDGKYARITVSIDGTHTTLGARLSETASRSGATLTQIIWVQRFIWWISKRIPRDLIIC